MKIFSLLIIMIFTVGCSTHEVTFNKEICEPHNASDTEKLPKECQKYDEKAATKASLPAIDRECKSCLKDNDSELK